MKITIESENLIEIANAMRKLGTGYFHVKAADDELRRLITTPPRKEENDDPNHDHS